MYAKCLRLHVNQDVYIVAYEKDNPNRNYFTDVNVTFKKKDFSNPVRIGVATNLPFFVVVLIMTIIIIYM